MENYTEYLVKKKFSGSDTAKTALVIFTLLFICVSVGLWLGFASAIVLLIFGGYGAWYVISGLKREYEYVLTNDHLDVDIIVAQRSRRRMCGFDMDEMEICAKVNDADKNGEMSRGFVKTYEAVSAPGSENSYFVIFGNEKGLNLLTFEPDEKILDGMSMYTRSKIFR